tara:strand:+ start:635 stop:1876 length:1242 start_codon:yes stop_codon:yes gene_type:complete
MPTFSQQFLANLGTGGGMLQGFSDLGGAIGGVGGQIKERRRLAEEAAELKNSGLKPGTSGYIAIQARQAAARGDRDLAIKYANAAAVAKNNEETLALATLKNKREQQKFSQEQEGTLAVAKGVITDLHQASTTKKDLSGNQLTQDALRRVNQMLLQASGAGMGAAKLVEEKNKLIGGPEKELYVITDSLSGTQRVVSMSKDNPVNLGENETISKIASTVYEGSAGITGNEQQFNIEPKEFGGGLEGVNIIAEATGFVDRIRKGLEGNVITESLVEAEDTVGAYQVLTSTVKDIEGAFAKNPKFPEGEREQIQNLGLSELAQSVFSSESAIRSKLKASVDMFEGMRIREINFQNDPNTESGARRDSQDRAKTLSESISKIKGILQSGQQNATQNRNGLPDDVEVLVNQYNTGGD